MARGLALGSNIPSISFSVFTLSFMPLTSRSHSIPDDICSKARMDVWP